MNSCAGGRWRAPTLGDRVYGSVGSVALARPDISDTLPGVAIAISLVPPLTVAGLTLQSGAPGQCLGALLLFATNVAAILASGIVVMTLYRAGQVSGQPAAPAFGRPIAIVLIVLLLAAVLVPLWINSDRIDKTTIRQAAECRASGQSRPAAHTRHQTLAFRRCSAGRPPVRR